MVSSTSVTYWMKNNYTVSSDKDTIYIQLYHRHLGILETQIDSIDLPIVNQFNTTWSIGYKNGHIDGVKTKVQQNGIRKQIWLHRLIMQPDSDKVVDHIDGNTLNNKSYNLRIVSPEENATNLCSFSKNKSGYTNIYLERDGKYRVRIKNQSFGRYGTLQEAINIRDKHIKNIFSLRDR